MTPTWEIRAKFTDGLNRSFGARRQISCADPWRAQKLAGYLMSRKLRGGLYGEGGRAWIKQQTDKPRLIAGEFTEYDWAAV